MSTERDPAAYLEWLTGDPQAGQPEAERLLSFPAEGWDDFLAAHPYTLNWHAVERLLGRAHELLDSDPAQSVDITAMLARHLDRFPVVAGTEVAVEIQRISVWRERAEALSAMDEFRAALLAAERGVAAATTPARHYALEKAQVRRVMAVSLHELGRDLEALRILREDLAVFEDHADHGGLLDSLITLGELELMLRHLPRAQATLQRALALATSRRDEPRRKLIAAELEACEELLGGSGERAKSKAR